MTAINSLANSQRSQAAEQAVVAAAAETPPERKVANYATTQLVMF